MQQENNQILMGFDTIEIDIIFSSIFNVNYTTSIHIQGNVYNKLVISVA